MAYRKRSLQLAFVIFCILIINACQPNLAKEDQKEDNDDTKELPEILLKALNAHGGLKKWEKFKSLTFEVNFNERLVDQQRVDLHNRKVLISSDNYRLGFDGNDVWYTGQEEKEFPAGSARFYHNLHFYFFAMPFVFADPGLDYKSLGQKRFRGLEYDVLQITYEQGVGDSPNDVYIIYLHPETHQMELLLYTVTYFGKRNSQEYSARYYKDWQWVNGMLLPYTCEKYRWQSGSLSEHQYTNAYTNVELDELPVDQSMFLAPLDAQISN